MTARNATPQAQQALFEVSMLAQIVDDVIYSKTCNRLELHARSSWSETLDEQIWLSLTDARSRADRLCFGQRALAGEKPSDWTMTLLRPNIQQADASFQADLSSRELLPCRLQGEPEQAGAALGFGPGHTLRKSGRCFELFGILVRVFQLHDADDKLLSPSGTYLIEAVGQGTRQQGQQKSLLEVSARLREVRDLLQGLVDLRRVD
ncbi:uncharacterized protein L969DRAFT_47302 [Mixia osmundae IAM 14324]|uniref:Mediator of RNA polymerase II transcription subunit 18 n=1 Tax=Mixia osmundae (strain CBS 9802 / IAM 14324 / JCM 22182 / KY 12970) TaxID=764103 RepID=G7E927_MIXOS|nr:uncharacterized protein L969DRAFT_47302 [Mixia osmundae IAM 14324]KEI40280.1 hypothetical protein L969DRAFT_47302 [Mixia osmundae IAM 14324]GAA99645.1 hypothetical protein E5Q_06346 [Mixia osmundae IAM 14324]